MKIDHRNFDGIVPLVDSTMLPENSAIVAEDVDLRRGDLVPYAGSVEEFVLPDDQQKSIYRADDGTWLYWESDDVDVVRSPVDADEYERLFYTGAGDGKLHQYGTFGDREVGVEQPVRQMMFDTYPLLDPSTNYAKFKELEKGNEQKIDHGELSESSQVLNGLYDYTFEFPEWRPYEPDYSDCNEEYIAENPGEEVKFYFPGLGEVDASNLGVKVEQEYDGHLWGYVTLTAVSGVRSHTSVYDTNCSRYKIYWDAFTYSASVDVQALYPAEYYSYTMTYVNDLGQEGPAWDSPMGEYFRDYNTRVVLSDLPVPTDSTVVKKRLYRSAGGSDPARATFALVAELDPGTTTYEDWVRTSDLGMTWEYREGPPDGLRGLVFHPARFLAGFKGDTVYMSDPYLPHSWPYHVNVDASIVALAVSGNDIIVLTDARPTMLSGTNPGAMRQAKLMVEQSCVSKRGVCHVESVVVYPSPDGLVFIRGGGAQVVTSSLIHPKDWRAWKPETMFAAQYNGKVFMWTDEIGLIFDAGAGADALVTHTLFPSQEAYNELKTDGLYYVSGDRIMRFDADEASPLTYTWRGRDFEYRRPVGFNKVRVIAEAYPVVLNVYVNGVVYKSMDIESDKVYNLPFRRRDERWSIECVASVPVHSIECGQATGDFLS